MGMHMGSIRIAAPAGKNTPTNWLLPADVTKRAVDDNKEACSASIHFRV